MRDDKMRWFFGIVLTSTFLAKNEPVLAATLTVDATGHANFKSIGAAFEKASPGDTILVKPGVYREAVRPKSGVKLSSEKGPVLTSIFVEHGGRGVFVDHATNVVVEGSKLAAQSPARSAGIDPFQYAGAIHPKAIPEMLKKPEAAADSPSAQWDIGLHDFANANQPNP